MSITFVLVGRTNVGKSTLFNFLTKSKAALTANLSGVTRDRHEGSFRYNGHIGRIIDTGGLEGIQDDLSSLVKEQVEHAIASADQIGLVVDAQDGLVYEDEKIITFLRQFNKPILCIINKSDKQGAESTAVAEFAPLGFSMYPVSALQGRGFKTLLERLFSPKDNQDAILSDTPSERVSSLPLKVTVIGKPNAGKSTLINQLLGENRQIVSNQAGTTRDSIEIPFWHQGTQYTLVDTAGIRRISNVTTGIEEASVKQSLGALQESTVIILLIDAKIGITDQDLRLLQLIVEAGRAIVVLANKWDCLDQEEKLTFQTNAKRRLRFLPFVEVGFISSLRGTGLSRIIPLVQVAYQHATKKLSTAQLTRLLQQALYEHSPPRKAKLRYAHPGGYNPPIIIIHGSHTEAVTATYKRYLHNFYQKQLNITGTPIKIKFKEKRSD